jgi:hypothetical protein
VLTGVRSRSHLVYAASYVREVLEATVTHDVGSGHVDVVVLATGDALGQGTQRHQQVRTFLDDPRVRLHFDDTGAWVRAAPVSTELLCIGAPSVRAFASFVRIHRRRPRVVVVDEGLGSYGSWATRRAAYRREGGAEPRATARALAVAAGARLLPDERWSLYRRSGTAWWVDERVAREFRERLEGQPPAADVVVYLTQPWSALGVMTRSVYAAHLASVRDAVAADGRRLLIKPHPWEGPQAYGDFDVIDGATPAELDRTIAGAALVIGANSTALLNLSAVHRTPVVRVTAPALSGLDAALADRQRSLLNAFLPPPVEVGDLPRVLAAGAGA